MKINILIPGDFRSNRGEEALKCSVKASDGHLYPLKSSLIFIHKPVIYIKLSEIKFVEFSRIGQLGGQGISRSFDVTITKIKDEPSIAFAGIDKEEQKNLMSYFKSKNVKVRTIDIETNQQIDLSDEEEEEEEEESKGGKKRTAAIGAQKAVGKSMEEEYDSEEDEDFNEDESPDVSESSEGSDASMEDAEDDIDEDEVKEMKK